MSDDLTEKNITSKYQKRNWDSANICKSSEKIVVHSSEKIQWKQQKSKFLKKTMNKPDFKKLNKIKSNDYIRIQL